MKNLFAAALLAPLFAFAASGDTQFQVRNASDNNAQVLVPAPAASANGLFYLKGSTGKPYRATLGSGLDLTSDVLTAPLQALSVGSPNTRTLSLATAYQCTTSTKACVLTVNLTSTATLTLGGGATITGEVRVGSANTVASGASGTPVGLYRNSLTGTLVVGITINTDSYNTITVVVPANNYFAIRATAGSMTVVSAYDQQIN